MKKSRILWAVVLFAAPVLTAPPVSASTHLHGMKAVLKCQRFIWYLGPGAILRKIGTVHSAGKAYDIYFYQYDNPHGHGMQQIVVFRNRHQYLGSYVLESSNCRKVQGDRLLCDGPADLGNQIVFHNGLPPKRVIVNGDMANLYNPADDPAAFAPAACRRERMRTARHLERGD